MTTTTARYGLTKINVLTDNVDVVTDFNNNADAIDLKLGTQVCTSSTRPSSPVQGMLAFETDTSYTRVWKGSAWQTAGNAVTTSGARPANPIQGDEVYETDTGFTRSRGSSAWNGFLPAFVNASAPANPIAGDLFYATDIDAVVRYTGSGWRITSIVPCTSTTRPSVNRGPGSAIYETDTTRLLVWNGTAWEQKAFSNYVCTSSTHPASPFTGLEIFETDTGLNAVYNGTNYMYGLQQLAPTQSVSAAASVTFSGLPAVNRLMIMWRLRSSTAGTSLQLQIDNDTTSGHYVWAKNAAHSGSSSTSASTGDTHIEIGTIAGNSTANYFGCGTLFVNGWNATNGFCNTDSISNAWDSATSTAYWVENQGGLYVGTAVAHTSLKILPGGGTVTGEITIYGGP